MFGLGIHDSSSGVSNLHATVSGHLTQAASCKDVIPDSVRVGPCEIDVLPLKTLVVGKMEGMARKMLEGRKATNLSEEKALKNKVTTFSKIFLKKFELSKIIFVGILKIFSQPRSSVFYGHMSLLFLQCSHNLV